MFFTIKWRNKHISTNIFLFFKILFEANLRNMNPVSTPPLSHPHVSTISKLLTVKGVIRLGKIGLEKAGEGVKDSGRVWKGGKR
jgi:hypothetical protein